MFLTKPILRDLRLLAFFFNLKNLQKFYSYETVGIGVLHLAMTNKFTNRVICLVIWDNADSKNKWD